MLKFTKANFEQIKSANSLVERRFAEKGHKIANPEKFFGVERTVFVAQTDDLPIATISVMTGSHLELDDLYEDETKALRAKTEGSIVQVGRFAVDKGHVARLECRLLKELIARSVAFGIEFGAGKLTMKLHPEDFGFYFRLNCTLFGTERYDPEVGNTAIAMFYDLGQKRSDMRHNFASKILDYVSSVNPSVLQV